MCASKGCGFSSSSRGWIWSREALTITIIHPGYIKTPLTSGRDAQMPFLMELDDAVKKMVRAIEKRRKRYSFPWQLATIVRAESCPRIASQISRANSFRE